MKSFNRNTVIISAASLILSGLASAEVLTETKVGEVPGAGNRTPTIDTDNMTVPEPYLPETKERPFSWNYSLPDQDRNADNVNFRSMQSDRMSIRGAQQALNDLGYTIQVDGIAGSETKTAIRDFQAANGIAQSGRLDTATVAALRDATTYDPDRLPASFEDEDYLYEPAFPDYDEPGNLPRPATDMERPGSHNIPK